MTDITLEQRAALLRYGRHEADCDTRHDSAFKPKPRCTCGFEAALRLSAGADWVLVPREPTDAMVDAAWDSEDATSYVGEHKVIIGAYAAWAAMLAAAPRHEMGEVQGNG